MNFETWLQSDLTKPLKVQALHGVFFSADNAANLIGVEVFDGGTAASLSGTCIGYAIRADGGTLTITGTVSGNKASIILPTSAYVIEGPLDIVIKVVNGSVKTTVGACRGYVQRATTDTIIDPGHVIPSLEELLAQIDACEQATEAANTAASNANSKATAANTAASNANTATGNANTATARANAAAAALENMDATASGLAAGASPTATVSTVNDHYRIALGIPKGDKGDKGDTGNAATITGTVTTYQNSTSGNTVPTGTWETAQPTTPQGQYLWTRTVLTWNNGQTTTLYSVSRQGIDGEGSVQSVNSISPDANGNVVLPVDATPTNGSSNPVSSDGVFDALAGKQDTLTFDSAPTSGSANPVTSGGVYTGLASKAPVVTLADGTDLDTVTTSGLYYLNTGGVNLPGTAINGYILVISNSTGSAAKQLFMRRGTLNTNDFLTYVRQFNGTTWSDWIKILTAGEAVAISEGGTGARAQEQAIYNLMAYAPYLTQYYADNDLDNLTSCGFYQVAGNAPNAPITNPCFILSLTNADGTRRTQFAWRSNTAEAHTIYVREHSSGTWTSWRILGSESLLPLTSYAYKAGDTFKPSTSVLLPSIVTGSTKRIIITIPTPKSLSSISTISVTSLKGGVRIPSGGYLGSGNASSPWASSDSFEWVGASGITISAAKSTDNLIQINIDSHTAYTSGNTTTALSNNIPVAFYCNWTLSFS